MQIFCFIIFFFRSGVLKIKRAILKDNFESNLLQKLVVYKKCLHFDSTNVLCTFGKKIVNRTEFPFRVKTRKNQHENIFNPLSEETFFSWNYESIRTAIIGTVAIFKPNILANIITFWKFKLFTRPIFPWKQLPQAKKMIF